MCVFVAAHDEMTKPQANLFLDMSEAQNSSFCFALTDQEGRRRSLDFSLSLSSTPSQIRSLLRHISVQTSKLLAILLGRQFY